MKRLALLLLLLLPAPAQAGVADAVVRITSHGASATVIHTAPGRTLLLGCAHAYEGRDRTKPMTIDAPSPGPGVHKRVRITLLAVDYRADLSLVQVDDGPWPYSAAVPSLAGYQPGRLVSAGFDQMGPLVAAGATRLTTTYTREKPIPGRSGGGLIDEHGQLFGVCQGYEVRPNGRGMYVDLPTILTFLRGHGWTAEGQAVPQVVEQQRPAPRVIEQRRPVPRVIEQQCPT